MRGNLAQHRRLGPQELTGLDRFVVDKARLRELFFFQYLIDLLAFDHFETAREHAAAKKFGTLARDLRVCDRRRKRHHGDRLNLFYGVFANSNLRRGTRSDNGDGE